jgi:hypothetical protein
VTSLVSFPPHKFVLRPFRYRLQEVRNVRLDGVRRINISTELVKIQRLVEETRREVHGKYIDCYLVRLFFLDEE